MKKQLLSIFLLDKIFQDTAILLDYDITVIDKEPNKNNWRFSVSTHIPMDWLNQTV